MDNWRLKKIGGKSKYRKKREKEKRPHRRLKKIFEPKKLLVLSINKKNKKHLKVFNQGRNADGRPRKPKYYIPVKSLDKFIIDEANL